VFSPDGKVVSFEMLTARFRDTITASCIGIIFRKVQVQGAPASAFTEHGLTGIEIRSRGEVDGSDARALRAVAPASAEDWCGGIIVYQGLRLRLVDPDYPDLGRTRHAAALSDEPRSPGVASEPVRRPIELTVSAACCPLLRQVAGASSR
jgi:hypothetical protein